MRARIPFVTVRTIERSRASDLVRAVAKQLNLSFLYHSPARGLRDLVSDRVLSEDRGVPSAIDIASQQFLSNSNVTFVFSDVQDIGGDTPLARELLDLATLAERGGNSVVVFTNEPVWPALQRIGMPLLLDPPDQDEMEAIIRACIEPYRGDLNIEWDDADFIRAASMLAGITRIEAENIVATLVASDAITKRDINQLSRAKDQLFADLSGVERVTVDPSVADIGGLDNLRTWLAKERRLLTADLRARNMRPPRGVLLVGVPGCGKSLSAKAIAASWELPLYRLDMSSILGQYVGESEGRLREALATADHVAPCVLWIDEIEKALGGGSHDSTGITQRLIGQFLYWLQESEARVFVVATANDVSQLPPELLRRGRFDELFFVDLPDEGERREILSIYIRRQLQQTQVTPGLLDDMVKLSDGFTGADLASAIREIGKEEVLLVADDKPVDITEDFMRQVFENVVPLVKTNPERIEQIRQWGMQRAVPASSRQRTDPSTGGGRGRVVLAP